MAGYNIFESWTYSIIYLYYHFSRSGDAVQMRFIRRESDVDNAPIEFIDYGCREK